jgi:hypothetical protein
MRPGPQPQRFQRLPRGGAEDRPVQGVALRVGQFGVGQFEVAQRHPALARAATTHQPGDAVRRRAQPCPGQAGDGADEDGQQAGERFGHR